MIVVIADDFTGAAELAGLGLRHGLTVELDIEGVWSTGADLLVVATDTRSKILAEALQELQTLSAKITEQKPLWIYKKIDSVLRGHIIEESDHRTCQSSPGKSHYRWDLLHRWKTLAEYKFFGRP